MKAMQRSTRPVVDLNAKRPAATRKANAVLESGSGGAVPAGSGARLHEERARLGLSQKDLATALGISIKTVYHHEQEVTSMTLAFLDEFARLGGDVEYVIFGQRSK